MADPATTDDSTLDPKSIAKQLGLSLPPDYSGNVIDLAKRTEQLSKERASKIDPLVKQQAEAAERQPEESERAWRNIEPFKPTPPPDQRQFQEDPLTKFFSLGSIVGILASAATHQPWTTSFTAAAAAIDARNRGDAEAYDNAFKAWKDNTQNLFERHQAQTEDWKTLQEKFKDDAIGRDAAIRAYQAKYGDEIDATYRAAGMYGQADDIMQKRNDAIEKMQLDYPKIVSGGVQTGGMLALQDARKLPDDDPTKQDKIKAAQQQITDGITMSVKAGQVVDPNSVLETAGLIANYKYAPLSAFALRSPWGQAVMAQVSQLNPNYNATLYGERSKAVRDFGTGPQGNTVRSFNVAIQHLQVLGDLAKALENGDVQAVNKFAQAYAEQTGGTAPTNFDSAKRIVAQEITKAVVGNISGISERQEAADTLQRQLSEEQLSGVIDTYQKLMTGQLRGLRQQYEQSTGLDNFNDLLAPQTIEALGSGEYTSSPGAPKKGAVEEGYRFKGGDPKDKNNWEKVE